MLDNPKWYTKEISVRSLRNWLEMQKPEGTYNWRDPWPKCVVGEWLGCEKTDAARDAVLKLLLDSGHYSDIVKVAQTQPWTYGAALKRADAIERKAA